MPRGLAPEDKIMSVEFAAQFPLVDVLGVHTLIFFGGLDLPFGGRPDGATLARRLGGKPIVADIYRQLKVLHRARSNRQAETARKRRSDG